MTSYITLLNKLEAFCNAHYMVEKFGADFKEQMSNFATIDEKYPIVFVVPVSSLSLENTVQYSVEIYCFDIIQKNRANINNIISDTDLILNDLYLEFAWGDDLDVNILGDPSRTPLNNDLLDYAAGHMMAVTFEVSNYTECQIPLS